MKRVHTVVIASVFCSVIVLIAIGIGISLSISSNRFDCQSTQRRMCSDAFIEEAYLKPEYLKELFDLIRQTGEAFDEAKILYCAVGGTLLSATRGNHLLIPWDDDADIAVFATQWRNETLRSALALALERRGLTLIGAHGLLTDRIKFIRSLDRKTDAPFIDVFVYAVDPLCLTELHYADPLCRARFPRERMQLNRMFPLQKATLRLGSESFSISTPYRAAEYLQKTYGKDWQTKIVVANHKGISMIAPCTMTIEQTRRFLAEQVEN